MSGTSPHLADAVAAIRDAFPIDSADLRQPPADAIARLCGEISALEEAALTAWALLQPATVIRVAAFAFPAALPKVQKRLARILELRWQPRLWPILRWHFESYPLNQVLLELLAPILTPWVRAQSPKFSGREFWLEVFSRKDILTTIWRHLPSDQSLVDGLVHLGLARETPLDYILLEHQIEAGSATRLRLEPLPRLATALQRLSSASRRAGAVAHYLNTVSPEEWNSTFLEESLDPLFRNNTFYEIVEAKLNEPALSAFRQRCIRAALLKAFGGSEHNERFQFWTQFTSLMTALPRTINLASGASIQAWLIAFEKLEVVEFDSDGDAAYFYRRGTVDTWLAVDDFPTASDLKDRVFNFFSPVHGLSDNRMTHQGDWRARWRPLLWRILHET